MGGNANGDLKLKPVLVYSSEIRISLKRYIKTELPDTWK
jgi:hypothetical protein